MESRSFRGIGDVLILPPHSFDIGCCCRLGEVEVEVEVVGRRSSRVERKSESKFGENKYGGNI